MNPRRLYRSRDRQLAGVAGGMAEYLDIDPTVIRILWILAAVVSVGAALLLYLVLAIVVPQAPFGAPVYGAPAYTGQGYAGPAFGAPAYAGQGYATPSAATPASAGGPTPSAGMPGWAPQGAAAPAWGPAWSPPSAAEAPARTETRGFGAAAIVGVVLIAFGAIALADTVLPAWSAAAIVGPVLILALGAALLMASIRRPAATAAATAAPGTTTEPAEQAVPDGPSAAPAGGPAPWATTDTQPIDPVEDGLATSGASTPSSDSEPA